MFPQVEEVLITLVGEDVSAERLAGLFEGGVFHGDHEVVDVADEAGVRRDFFVVLVAV